MSLTDTERISVVDESDRVTGVIDRSAEAFLRPGEHVRVVNAFVRNALGEVWIPRRTASKRRWPGALDMSVGGYVRAGETYEAAFRRETLEELNLDVDGVPWREVAALQPVRDGVSSFMRVYEVRLEVAPQFNPEDFCEAFWLTRAALLERLRAGEAAKGDLLALAERCL